MMMDTADGADGAQHGSNEIAIGQLLLLLLLWNSVCLEPLSPSVEPKEEASLLASLPQLFA